MKIKVTHQHIFHGARGSRDSCPIALAIRGQLGVVDINVGSGEIRCGKTKFHPPAKVEKFIDRFDESEPVKPFTFDLK